MKYFLNKRQLQQYLVLNNDYKVIIAWIEESILTKQHDSNICDQALIIYIFPRVIAELELEIDSYRPFCMLKDS